MNLLAFNAAIAASVVLVGAGVALQFGIGVALITVGALVLGITFVLAKMAGVR